MSSGRPSAPVVIAMLKAPRAGFVKTRLAREIGDAPAAAVYRRLVEHQMTSIPREWRVEIHFAPAAAESELRSWLGPAHDYHAQLGDDLGGRLIHATTGAFDRGARAVIAIGGDCPGLDEHALRAAESALPCPDIVLGPALDGGYYLVGMRRPTPAVFRDIPWGSADVLAATVERVRAAGLAFSMLTPMEDVDDLASWRRLQSLLPALAGADGVGQTR